MSSHMTIAVKARSGSAVPGTKVIAHKIGKNADYMRRLCVGEIPVEVEAA